MVLLTDIYEQHIKMNEYMYIQIKKKQKLSYINDMQFNNSIHISNKIFIIIIKLLLVFPSINLNTYYSFSHRVQ